MKPWREVLFLALSICYVQAQYDFGADNSPPASKYKGVGGAVGAHIGIDNPHASGGYSPTLPPSNINYYPPPDIPRPDFRVWSSAQKSNEVVPNAVQAASTQAYATSGSSGASGAGAGAGVSIGKVPPVKFTIRNLGPNPDFLKAYRGKGASVSAKLEGSSATGGKITEESSQIDLAGSGQSGTSASIPNGVINGKTPEPTDNKVDTTSSGESYKSAESSGSTAPEQKGTDETGGSGNNVENAGGSGSTVESSQGAGASTGTAEGGQSGGAGSVGGPVEVNAAHGSESSEAGEGSHGASGEAGGIPSGGSITEIGSSGESSASSGGSGGSSTGSSTYGHNGGTVNAGSVPSDHSRVVRLRVVLERLVAHMEVMALVPALVRREVPSNQLKAALQKGVPVHILHPRGVLSQQVRREVVEVLVRPLEEAVPMAVLEAGHQALEVAMDTRVLVPLWEVVDRAAVRMAHQVAALRAEVLLMAAVVEILLARPVLVPLRRALVPLEMQTVVLLCKTVKVVHLMLKLVMDLVVQMNLEPLITQPQLAVRPKALMKLPFLKL
ncbi:hypothetical protein QR680_003247 [Steinernema hermaphroditum]|uniref:Uncharacterized protein n=1 Tax=Steinernema hermaphroditum TaxID=289476 RepID=A0AA39H6Y2_9BILA|nr:hypothetical protein QR680_003247 [Steinernema hermaphroditum]